MFITIGGEWLHASLNVLLFWLPPTREIIKNNSKVVEDAVLGNRKRAARGRVGNRKIMHGIAKKKALWHPVKPTAKVENARARALGIAATGASLSNTNTRAFRRQQQAPRHAR